MKFLSMTWNKSSLEACFFIYSQNDDHPHVILTKENMKKRILFKEIKLVLSKKKETIYLLFLQTNITS